jgi:hypothetical protein
VRTFGASGHHGADRKVRVHVRQDANDPEQPSMCPTVRSGRGLRADVERQGAIPCRSNDVKLIQEFSKPVVEEANHGSSGRRTWAATILANSRSRSSTRLGSFGEVGCNRPTSAAHSPVHRNVRHRSHGQFRRGRPRCVLCRCSRSIISGSRAQTVESDVESNRPSAPFWAVLRVNINGNGLEWPG